MQRTCPGVQAGCADALGRIIAWPDVEFPWVPTVGVGIIGEISRSHVFREATVQADFDVDEFFKLAPAWHDIPLAC